MADEVIAGNTQSTDTATAPVVAPAPAPAVAQADSTPQQQATTDQAATAPEVKPVEGEPAKAAEAPEVKAGAPEKYEFKAPENTVLDDKVLSAYSDVAKELNLPQEAAQKVLDKVAPIMAAQQAEAIKQLNTEWLTAVKADKEFGGDKVEANIAVARKAIDAFGTPELKALLNQTGLGNNPELIRAFYRAGKAISEDRFVSGGAASTGSKNLASALYPNQH